MNPPTALDRVRQIVVALGVVGGITLGVTGDYGAEGPLLVDSSGDGSDSPILPAGYAFSIWGLIYLGALAFAVHHARPSRAGDPMMRRIGWFAAAAYLGQGLWSRTAELGQLALTGLVVAATLAAAVLAYRPTVTPPAHLDRATTWSVRAPLALHLGWLTLAAILTTTEALRAAGVGDLLLGPAVWSVVVLLAAGVIAAAVTVLRPGSLAFPGAVVWGLVAVVVEQAPTSTPVAVTAAVAAAVVTAAAARTVGSPVRPDRAPAPASG